MRPQKPSSSQQLVSQPQELVQPQPPDQFAAGAAAAGAAAAGAAAAGLAGGAASAPANQADVTNRNAAFTE
jgi:hypothetical protein